MIRFFARPPKSGSIVLREQFFITSFPRKIARRLGEPRVNDYHVVAPHLIIFSIHDELGKLTGTKEDPELELRSWAIANRILI